MTTEAPLELHRGEEKTYSVSIHEDGVPVDLTGFTLRTGVWWRGQERFVFTLGDGISILDLAPEPPSGDEDPAPQYTFNLTEEQSEQMPLGKIAYAMQTVVSADDVTIIRGPRYFKVLS